MKRITLPLKFLSFVFFASLCHCTGAAPDIIEKKCSTCHDSSIVARQKKTAEQWDRVLFGMKARGLKLTPDEEREVRSALAAGYTAK
jgi:hypothetical protein